MGFKAQDIFKFYCTTQNASICSTYDFFKKF